MASWRMGLIWAIAGVVGCAAPRAEPGAAPQRDARNAARPIDAGHSVQGRPLVAWLYGTAPVKLFIFAGIHGDEVGSVHVAERLQALLESTDAPRVSGLMLMTCANPDGYARKTRTNARGVDLNRNFPATNFRPSVRYGSTPLCEPESAALAELVRRYNPTHVISIHSISGRRQCNNFDGVGEPLARALAAGNGYTVNATLGYATPGSFGSWAGVDRGLSVVTLELPRSASGEHCWEQNRDALLAAIRYAGALRD